MLLSFQLQFLITELVAFLRRLDTSGRGFLSIDILWQTKPSDLKYLSLSTLLKISWISSQSNPNVQWAIYDLEDELVEANRKRIWEVSLRGGVKPKEISDRLPSTWGKNRCSKKRNEFSQQNQIYTIILGIEKPPLTSHF